LNDPQYIELSALQKTAVEDLHTAYFIPRPTPNPEPVARQAFERFRHGLASGDWEPFLEMLTDDFVFRFPIGEWKGEHHGKDAASQFFAYAYPQGLFITHVHNVGISGNTALFEFEDEGLLRGNPYHGRVIVALEVRDDKISAYREYFGA
jgi:ketosteroid isomerase-like protein